MASQERSIVERAVWILEQAELCEDMHEIADPAVRTGASWPLSLSLIYSHFDGASFFHESIVLYPSAQVTKEELGWHVGQYEGDMIVVAKDGRVFRMEEEGAEVMPEGTRFDRWLAGAVAAESLLFDDEGEFREGAFSEDSELTAEFARRMELERLKRDPKAIGPKWRLARMHADAEEWESARSYLAEVVDDELGQSAPLAWAWLDLARASERLGELETASEEAETAASVHEDPAQVAYFLAHAARIAQLAGDEERSSRLCERALKADPNMVQRHIDGARALLSSGERVEARELLIIAKLIAPTNLGVLDLLRQIES